MTRMTFASLEELKAWCNRHIEDKGLQVYWGWLENLGEWYGVADLLSDASTDWFVRIDEDGNEVPCSVEIHVRDGCDPASGGDEPMNKTKSTPSYVWCTIRDQRGKNRIDSYMFPYVVPELEELHFFREYFTPPETPWARMPLKNELLDFDFPATHRKNRKDAEEDAYQDGLDLGYWRDRMKAEADEIRRTVSDAMEYFIKNPDKGSGGTSTRTDLNVSSPRNLLMQVAYAYQAEKLLGYATREDWIEANWDDAYYFRDKHKATGILEERGYRLIWENGRKEGELSFLIETEDRPPIGMVIGAMDSLITETIRSSKGEFKGEARIVVLTGKAAEGIVVYRESIKPLESLTARWEETKIEDGSPRAWELSMEALSVSGTPLFGHIAGEYVRHVDGTYALSRYSLGIIVSVSRYEKVEIRRGKRTDEGYLLDYGLPEGREAELIQEERQWMEEAIVSCCGKHKVSWSTKMELGELSEFDDYADATITCRISGLTEKNTRLAVQKLRNKNPKASIRLFSLLTGEATAE